MPSISAVLIVLDEEAFLQDCLDSLRGVVDEIVVVDTGSSDASRHIARTASSRCYDFKWSNDFAAARNFSLEKATGDYVLAIDADERVVDPPSAAAALRAFAGRFEPHVLGTVAVRSPIHAGHNDLEVRAHLPRFFCRERFHYRGAIHEQLVSPAGKTTTAVTGVAFHHLGYALAAPALHAKTQRNIRLLTASLQTTPDDEYCHYQLGKAYYCQGDHTRAADAFEKALKLLSVDGHGRPNGAGGTIAPDIFIDLLVTLAYTYANKTDVPKARQMLRQYARRSPLLLQSPDFHYVCGYLTLMQGKLGVSRQHFLEALQLGPHREIVLGAGSHAALFHLGLLDEASQNVPGAMAHYLLALQTKPDYAQVLRRCIDLMLEHRAQLPNEIWHVADSNSLHSLFLAKYAACLAGRRHDDANFLLGVAQGASPALYAACRQLETRSTSAR